MKVSKHFKKQQSKKLGLIRNLEYILLHTFLDFMSNCNPKWDSIGTNMTQLFSNILVLHKSD